MSGPPASAEREATPPPVLQGIARIREQVLFDGARAHAKRVRFWVLIVLSALIASAGIVADSTATVIGAMIIAPLMTPILGVVVAIVTTDGRNLARSGGEALAGSAAVVAIAWAFAHAFPVDVASGTNAQVAGQVSPSIPDLVTALATGAVGAFALVRRDVSDTLPGVAIAISLVLPLSVVGVALEAGDVPDAVGALLLFATNVVAILLSGLLVLAGARAVGLDEDRPTGLRRLEGPLAMLAVGVAAVALWTTLSGRDERGAASTDDREAATSIATRWADAQGWTVLRVDLEGGTIVVRAAGQAPAPAPAALRTALDTGGLERLPARVVLIPAQVDELPATG